MTAPSRCMSHARFVLAGLATIGLAVAACNSATPPASVTSSRGSEPTITLPSTTTGALSSGPVSASPPAVPQSQTIHLIEHPTNVNSVEVGSLTHCSDRTSCQGDYLIGDNAMYDAITGKEVGKITFECFFIDTGSLLLHCPGSTLTLTGRGQIVINEIVDLGGEVRPDNGTVIGGTGEFLGATGTVTSGNRDFVITITR